MNKKISFKRPDKPVPREADDWVAENIEVPAKAAASKPGAKATAKTRPSRTVGTPPRDVQPHRSPQRSASLSEARWLDHMLASVDRQSDAVLRRVASLPLGDGGVGDGAANSLLAQMDARAQAVIDRMKALQSKVRRT
jgi:hypothetical protein